MKEKDITIKLKCLVCVGKGYAADQNEEFSKLFSIHDCFTCNGKGYIYFRVIDKRINSIKRKIKYEEIINARVYQL